MRYRNTLWIVSVLILFSAIVLWIVGRVLVLTQQAVNFPDFLIPRLAAWDFLLFCVAIGGLTMILVQIVRVLVPLRGRFHRDVLESWFEEGISRDEGSGYFERGPLSAEYAIRELKSYLRLSSDLYDLPIEQFCAQLGAVADLALEQRPVKSLSLLFCIVGPGGVEDLWRLVDLANSFPPGTVTGDRDERATLALAEAHATLARLIQRRIDGLQISAGTQWRRNLRWAVVSTSVGIGLLVSLSSLRGPGVGAVFSYALYGGMGGLMGGFIAMLLRDLTAIVELRRRQL